MGVKDDFSRVCICVYVWTHCINVLCYTECCLVTPSVALYWIREKFHEMYHQIIDIFKF